MAATSSSVCSSTGSLTEQNRSDGPTAARGSATCGSVSRESVSPRSSGRGTLAGAARFVRPVVLGALIALLVYYGLQGELNQEHLKRLGSALPTMLFLPAFVLLPLLGFPISIALLASGMKYGFGLSVAIAAVGMGLHTLAAWHVAQSLFHDRLMHWLRYSRFKLPTIPDRHQIWFTSLFVTVPGMPYAVKLYSLALTNLPFRRYLPIVWCFHVLNAIPFIGLGTAAVSISPVWWLVLVGLMGGSVLAAGRLLRRGRYDEHDEHD
ncbi:MAG: hypothetical protein RIK87_28905 [Fuerstiella sp.]